MLTDILIAIGARPQLVGVSSYDDEPEVKDLPRLGALLDPDVERIITLRPDLALVYGSQQDLMSQLTRASIPIFPYRHGGLSHVTATIREVGARTARSAEAAKLASDIEQRIAAVRKQVAGAPLPRTLLVFGRERGTLRGIYASGGRGFLNDMLTAAGGVNVYADVQAESVQASSEMVLSRAPEVILEIRSRDIPSADERQREMDAWKTLPEPAGGALRTASPSCRQVDERARPARRRRRRAHRARAPSWFVQMKILLSWSTGKDSAWTLHVLRQQHPHAVAGLLTTVNEAFDRVAMHAVRRALLDAQADAAGLPLHVVDLPWPCSNEQYEQVMGAAVEGFLRDGFTHVAFGDLFLEDVRRYREERLAGSGLTPLFPLWKTKPTAELAREMLSGGLEAYLTCVDPRKLDRSFAGRAFDAALLSDLPDGVDPCGENGEFHSFVSAGPMFSKSIAVDVGEIVERNGFVFADLCIPTASSV